MGLRPAAEVVLTLTITDPRLAEVGNGLTELSAAVGDQRLWFRIPADRLPTLRGEAFVCCLVVPAMVRGEPLEVSADLPVCPDFLEGVNAYMDVVRFWPKEIGHPLVPIPIRAACESAPVTDGALSFFSGGIDGLYTMVTAHDRIDAAVFSHGIDFQLDNPSAAQAVARNREWLRRYDIPLVEMASNARFVTRALGTRWNAHNGACLAGFAHALGGQQALIASGHAWVDWMGGGSHPSSDPLLSSAATQIEHHGYGPLRWQKLARVAEETGVLDLIRVCWQDREYNCGRCEKCRRTMLLLHLLNLEASSFPSTRKLDDALTGPVRDWEAACYARQALKLAQARGRTDAVRAMQSRLRAWTVRQWLQRADVAFTGGVLNRVRRGVLKRTVARTSLP